jgi:hypothetical protein
MSWARLDDNIAHHPKILRAGPEAALFWVLCLTYSQRFLTDGHVPDAALGAVGSWPAARARQLAAKLVQVRLLERCANGYQVHDFLDYNKPAAVARAERDATSRARSQAGRKGGLASGLARRTTARQTQETQQTRGPIASASEPHSKQTLERIVPPHEANRKQPNSAGASVLLQPSEAPSHPIRVLDQDQEQRRQTAATFAPPIEHPQLLEKLAHVTLDRVKSGEVPESDTSEELKCAAAKAHIRYDGDRTRKALDSAMVQRQRRPPP